MTVWYLLSLRSLNGEELTSTTTGNDRQFIETLYSELYMIHDTTLAHWPWYIGLWEGGEAFTLQCEAASQDFPAARRERLHAAMEEWHSRNHALQREAEDRPGPAGETFILKMIEP